MVASSGASLMSGVLRPENVGERPQCPSAKKVKFKPQITHELLRVNTVYEDGFKRDKHTINFNI